MIPMKAKDIGNIPKPGVDFYAIKFIMDNYWNDKEENDEWYDWVLL